MAQSILASPTTLQPAVRPGSGSAVPHPDISSSLADQISDSLRADMQRAMDFSTSAESAGKGLLIGMLSAFGSAVFIAIVLGLVYFLRYTPKGQILLDRIGRPGEFDDEQQFAKEEADALETMDDIQRVEYMRAKAYVQANPPESVETDISLSQFLAIQEKGVSAWEFEPELEVANCFVEGRTEIEFYDTECSVQSNLPIPKQNDVYYWEAKIYDKPETTSIAVGVSTKPYPLFRMPGLHKTSVAYTSAGQRRFNQPFTPVSNYGPPYVRGDVVGCGYRPRTGTVFFTRNGKKLEDVTNTLKTQNLFPTVGANGPCSVHVNFGQMGFVFIEANVKKWGLAPMTGSLAPPPPYGSEAGSILLEGGQHGVSEGQGYLVSPPGGSAGVAGSWMSGRTHGRSRSATVRQSRGQPTTSPGPHRSPTDISLTQLSFAESEEADVDAGEGTSGQQNLQPAEIPNRRSSLHANGEQPPPEYDGLGISKHAGRTEDEDNGSGSDSASTTRPGSAQRSRSSDDESRRLLPPRTSSRRHRGGSSPPSPPIPSYDAAVGGA